MQTRSSSADGDFDKEMKEKTYEEEEGRDGENGVMDKEEEDCEATLGVMDDKEQTAAAAHGDVIIIRDHQ